MRAKISELADKFSELADTEKTNTEKALKCERMIETVQKESDRNFEKFSENDSKLGRELLQQKVTITFFSSDRSSRKANVRSSILSTALNLQHSGSDLQASFTALSYVMQTFLHKSFFGYFLHDILFKSNLN